MEVWEAPQNRGLLPAQRGQQGPPLRILSPEASPYPRLRGTSRLHHMELLVMHWTGAHRTNLPVTLASLAHPTGCGLGSNEQDRSLHVIGDPRGCSHSQEDPRLWGLGG